MVAFVIEDVEHQLICNGDGLHVISVGLEDFRNDVRDLYKVDARRVRVFIVVQEHPPGSGGDFADTRVEKESATLAIQ